MDIDSNPGAALMLRAGAAQQQVSLSAIKRQAQQDVAVVTMATGAVQAPSSDPNRGRVVDTHA